MSSLRTWAALSLGGLFAASCASVPTPATKAPESPASATAEEGPIRKLALFDPAEPPDPPATNAAMPGMDHSKMDHSAPEARPTAADPASETYTCVMHPQIAEPKPGKCPICGMPLVKKPKEKK